MRSLISVHVAKAGGSSIRHLLQGAYKEHFLEDYEDRPANPLGQRLLDPDRYFGRQECLPDGIACVHGHFHPGKYLTQNDSLWFTMLRYPVDNMISIYWFWKALSRGSSPLHNYFLDNDLSIIEIVRLPILRWLFSQTYFGGFDMGRFDIVGKFEDREAVLNRLSTSLGVPLDVTVRENVTPECDERNAMTNDQQLRRRLEDILVDDIKFYERYAG